MTTPGQIPALPHQRRAAEPAAPAAEAAAGAARLPGYSLPELPAAAWSVDTRRASRISRLLLLGLLAVQAGLSLRMHGRAFEDEALYIAAGHLELNHLLHGTPVPGDFGAFFSGHPLLYPVLAGAVDSWGGLTAVRLVSLLLMLGTTALLFSMTRRMFSDRAALGATALFSVVQSTIFLGYFATFDAAALFLLAVAAWLLVRTTGKHPATALLAAFPAVLAMAVKYAAGLFLPTLLVLALLSGAPVRRNQAVLRGLSFGLGTGVLLLTGAYFSGSLNGLNQTTTGRAHGTSSPLSLADLCAQWGGLVFLTALGGAVAYVRRARMGEMPWAPNDTPGRVRRMLLGATLCGSALLPLLYQSYLHTDTSLFKHVGFGLLFAAPMAGLGLSRLVGPHFRHPQLGIMLYVVVLVFGMVQAHHEFTPPDSTRMTEVVQRLEVPNGHYLAEEYEIPAYYLRGTTTWDQWQSTFAIDYVGKDGKHHGGPEGFHLAVQEGYFNVIVLTGNVTPEADAAVTSALQGSSTYRLVATLPFHTQYGDNTYRIWTRL
ncbi:ArnT family glycosyltransferase [Kitasatospora sp. NPDC006697]|uniref:ArnT family glycosyltransferase n=1 Tax=Kitasatospora sp. NPDC006697 TaxID=3364020 RepID=UPI0036818C6A